MTHPTADEAREALEKLNRYGSEYRFQMSAYERADGTPVAHDHQKLANTVWDYMKFQSAEITRLTEQIAEARRLMEPFARLAENHPMRLKPVWPDLLIGGSCDPTEWNVYGSHFSAVSAFLGVK